MAAIQQMEHRSQGPRRAPRKSTRVDLTAMVDLGFLLITFFMLASSFQKPKAMEVNKPVPPDDHQSQKEIRETRSLTIVAGKNDRLYCYQGADADHLPVDTLSFSRQAIRQKLLQRKAEVRAQWGDDQDLIVLLKLFPKAKYRSLVDLLDEMEICGIQRYAIVDEWNTTDHRIAAASGEPLEGTRAMPQSR